MKGFQPCQRNKIENRATSAGHRDTSQPEIISYLITRLKERVKRKFVKIAMTIIIPK